MAALLTPTEARNVIQDLRVVSGKVVNRADDFRRLRELVRGQIEARFRRSGEAAGAEYEHQDCRKS
jgi:hypothetical protein